MSNDHSAEQMRAHQTSWRGLAKGFIRAAARDGIPAHTYRLVIPDLVLSIEEQPAHYAVEASSVLRQDGTDYPEVLLVRFSQHEALLAQAAARLHWQGETPQAVKIEYVPNEACGLTGEILRGMIDTLGAASEQPQEYQ